ncbi:hypothetical protein L211DRAFT_851088 [Terfezia boudieri ATCC MYA-4762]|uniref:Uncharacterized protein n=1 Tax=Terfezia boudieri ATCC MYA-4762 TaxID=1051890 RepID=A0A3N4LK68_9PEZI|nr:hypothetical protein L211DRAFT_851088 [Terfezia boudieri ATCC MYA-4762]
MARAYTRWSHALYAKYAGATRYAGVWAPFSSGCTWLHKEFIDRSLPERWPLIAKALQPSLQLFRTVLVNVQNDMPLTSLMADITISKYGTVRCVGSDVECYPPTSKEHVICCPPTEICTLVENSDDDKQGVFIAFCVPDPHACYPGLFSCPPRVNSCCQDGYLCDLRTWDNSTYPVCLADLLRSNNTSISHSTTTSSTSSTYSTIAATTTLQTGVAPPTNIVPGGGGESATNLNRSALVGLVVGAICGSVIVTLVVVFSVRKYYRWRRTKGGGTLIEQRNGEIPQPNDTKDYRPYESGGAEVLEAGGSGLAELPGQPAGSQMWQELPPGVKNSTNPQFAQSGCEDNRGSIGESQQQ